MLTGRFLARPEASGLPQGPCFLLRAAATQREERVGSRGARRGRPAAGEGGACGGKDPAHGPAGAAGGGTPAADHTSGSQSDPETQPGARTSGPRRAGPPAEASAPVQVSCSREEGAGAGGRGGQTSSSRPGGGRRSAASGSAQEPLWVGRRCVWGGPGLPPGPLQDPRSACPGCPIHRPWGRKGPHPPGRSPPRQAPDTGGHARHQFNQRRLVYRRGLRGGRVLPAPRAGPGPRTVPLLPQPPARSLRVGGWGACPGQGALGSPAHSSQRLPPQGLEAGTPGLWAQQSPRAAGTLAPWGGGSRDPRGQWRGYQGAKGGRERAGVAKGREEWGGLGSSWASQREGPWQTPLVLGKAGPEGRRAGSGGRGPGHGVGGRCGPLDRSS